MKYVRHISVVLNPVTKQEIHTLEDCFGQQHIVQIPLLLDEQFDSELQEEIEAMEQRAALFIERAKARGHNVEKMQKWKPPAAPGDCGCKH